MEGSFYRDKFCHTRASVFGGFFFFWGGETFLGNKRINEDPQ